MKKYYGGILFFVILLLGILTAVVLTGQKQDNRGRAAVAGGVGKIILSPATTAKYPREIFPVNINFQSGTSATDAPISSLSLRITYPFSGTDPELQVVDVNGNLVNTIFPSQVLVSSGDWAFPIKSVVKGTNQITIDFSAVNMNIAGYKSITPANLATIYFKIVRMPTTNPIVLSFDLTMSKMMTKSDNPIDVLDNPANGSITIQPATLKFGFSLQGVTKSGATNNFEVIIKGSVNKTYTSVSATSGGGVFTTNPILSLTDYAISSEGTTVNVLVKDGSHLRKNLGSMSLMFSNNVAPTSWNNTLLKAGDFNWDNKLTIADVSALLAVYTALSIPVTNTNRIYDVDLNNAIDINDIALVLANYTALEMLGDN